MVVRVSDDDIVMRAVRGESVQQIARQCQISESAVDAVIKRAKQGVPGKRQWDEALAKVTANPFRRHK